MSSLGKMTFFYKAFGRYKGTDISKTVCTGHVGASHLLNVCYVISKEDVGLDEMYVHLYTTSRITISNDNSVHLWSIKNRRFNLHFGV